MVVFVSEGEGRLSPREVTVGDHAKGLYEVTAGLSEGETVARGANFLVDSESRLKAALSAMAPPREGDRSARRDGAPAAPATPGPRAAEGADGERSFRRRRADQGGSSASPPRTSTSSSPSTSSRSSSRSAS